MGNVIDITKDNVVSLDKKRNEKNKASILKFRDHINNKIQQIANKVQSKPKLHAVDGDAPTISDNVKRITETIERINSITKKLQQAQELNDDKK
jgi:hypothetical protein